MNLTNILIINFEKKKKHFQFFKFSFALKEKATSRIHNIFMLSMYLKLDTLFQFALPILIFKNIIDVPEWYRL